METERVLAALKLCDERRGVDKNADTRIAQTRDQAKTHLIKAAEDAVKLTKNKYCSVSKMLEKSAAISYAVEYES